METTITPVRTYVFVYIALLILLALTISAAFFDLGALNTVIALVIAITKASLVAYIFMNVRYANKVTRLFVGAGLLWFSIMIFLTWIDYYTRVTGFSTWPPK